MGSLSSRRPSTVAQGVSSSVEGRSPVSGLRSACRAWRDGWKRVLAAPAIVAGVFVMTFVLALPLAITLRAALATHLGESLAAETAATGVNYDWWQEFTAQATGLETTFVPSIIGFAAVLDNVSGVLDARAPRAPIAAALALYLTGWAFLSGGIVDRYARQRPIRTHGFFAASGVYFFRFLRLAAIAGLVYWWLFWYVHPWLFDEQFVNLTRDLSVERNAFLIRVVFYVFFGALLVATSLVIDYAKVRIVVEDRRSALGALSASLRFIRRHGRQVISLYALNTLTFLSLLAVWALIAPGAGGAGLSIWAGFVIAQLYIVVRLAMKLQFIASQTALFQANLAHASYAAAPVPVWPESPAAEAIR
jgi:hypothetical protein